MIQLDTRPTNRDISLVTLIIQPILIDGIKVAQEKDPELKELREKANQGEAPGFDFTSDGILRTIDSRIVFPKDAKLRKEILDETHKTQYTVHP
jgi:hypothetical protein